jgi:hypothetical protein
MATPVPAGSTAPQPTAPPPPSVPGDAPGQAAQALFVLARHEAANQRLTLQLDPAGLGRIEIVIARPAEGPTEVSLTADRPETLLRLLRDHARLGDALDRAGLAPEARQVRFHLATTEPRAPDPAAPVAFAGPPAADAPMPAMQPLATAPSAQNLAAQHQGGEAGQREAPPRRARRVEPDTAATAAFTTSPRPPARARRGIDITA